jgi:outer membrane protein assembly factor BamB
MPRRRTNLLVLACVSALLASTVVATGASAAKPGCASPRHPGGEWTTLNGDLRNSRSQPAERGIGTKEAAGLQPAWSFSGDEVGATGGMRSTPIVANGCVYLGLGQGYLGDRGDVIALNADTGEMVWHAHLEGSVLGLAAANGMIYATPSLGTRGDVVLPVVTDTYQPAGSYAVAFDARTGRRMWTSQRLDDGKAADGTFINASPVPYEAGGRHLLFVPLAGGSGDGARVPMYFLDAGSGATVKKAYSLTDAEYDAGFGGTGIWSTAAYDPVTQHLFAGTADSDAHTHQHRYNDALLKIDANPRRATFGSVVGSYAGTTEHADLDAVIGEQNNPVCGSLSGADVDLPTFFDTSASVECLELDFDFGGSPNLYDDAAGHLRIGALQKSGVFHSVDAATMAAAWKFTVGPGGAFMDGGTAAVGDHDVYVSATPNVVFGLGRDTGAVRWVGATGADLFAYQPVTLANGVLYAINDAGFLVGMDAASGAPLLHRLISNDGGFQNCLGVGAGVAVARGLVYAPCDAGGLADLAGLPSPAGGLVAYR